ncbi:MAG: ribonuclease R [Chthoniobacteraceae bacterium]|nr:ribonuclease R [Chthoniobacteraceae bacterium]
MCAKPQDLAGRILALMRSPRYQPLDKVALSKKLGITPDDRARLRDALRALEERGEIARVRKDRYVLPEEAELVTGVLQVHMSGNAHLLSERPGQPDLYIASENLWTAMNGDRVVARILHEGIEGIERFHRRLPAAGERREGRVIRILKRASETLVGTLQKTQKFHFVIPDDPRIGHNIYVHPGAALLPQPPAVGDKVVVHLDEWTSPNVNPEGEIIEVLGAASAPGVDMLSIVRKYHLPTAFPDAVATETARIPEQVPPAELARREDLRDALIYTIDPDDARDFDDAIQVERTENGWRVGVHIADVSHYVFPGTELDKEAFERGNSVYLADRVIPMLPERLSNGICSLKPGVDRLTRSAFLEFTKGGKMRSARFSMSVIRSKARLTYKQTFAILSGKEPEPLSLTVPDRTEVIPEAVATNIRLAWQLASILRKNRFEAGSLDLDFPEVKVWLDAEGTPVKLEKVENDASHQLIEEFMLAANEAVARETKIKNYPSLYRIHENPEEEKLDEFRDLVRLYNYRVGDLTVRAEVQRLLEAIKGKPEEYALKISFLKSLKRAAYGTRALGHYGLAKVNYTHFTSPIRRYADLVVHRVLGHIGEARQRIAAADLPAVAERISQTERTAQDAERESVKLKKIEFFARAAERLDKFTAVILDVRNYGFVVELPEFLITGLVHVSALSDDFYLYDPARMRFVGRKTHRVFAAGEHIEVAVAKVDMYKQMIDFQPAPEKGKKAPAPKAAQGQAREPREPRPPRPSRQPRQPRNKPQGAEKAAPAPRQTGEKERPKSRQGGRRRRRR